MLTQRILPTKIADLPVDICSSQYNPYGLQELISTEDYVVFHKWLKGKTSENIGGMTVARIKQWEDTKLYIQEFGKLDDNWDGYGAESINEKVVSNACRIMDMLRSVSWLTLPEMAPTTRGTISLSWENEDDEMYLEIGNTRYSGYIDMGDSSSILIEDNMENFDVDCIYPWYGNNHWHETATNPITYVHMSLDPVLHAPLA